MGKYSKSKEIWRNWREQEKDKTGNDPINGFCLWEFEQKSKFAGFKLECWNTWNGKGYTPTIFQFWPNGNGFSTYVEKG